MLFRSGVACLGEIHPHFLNKGRKLRISRISCIDRIIEISEHIGKLDRVAGPIIRDGGFLRPVIHVRFPAISGMSD